MDIAEAGISSQPPPIQLPDLDRRDLNYAIAWHLTL